MTGRSGAPTMEDVAARAGVSRALVSLVMRDSPKVSDERRAAVLAAAEELGYRPNAAARSLAQRKTDTVGVVIDDLHNTFFADVADGVHEVAKAHGLRLMLNAVWLREDGAREVVDAFLEHRVDAVVLLGPRADDELLAEASANVPVVVVGSDHAIDGVDVVINDDAHGCGLVVDHLHSLGHTDIAHVDGGRGAGSRLRRQGFVDRMDALGLEPRVLPGDFTEVSGYEAAELLVRQDAVPTALFCANDLAAAGALDRLEKAGLDVPGDVSIVGYDNTALAAMHHVSLTTVNQPRREMGMQAMRMVLERIRGERSTARREVVEPSLVQRATTGPAPTRGTTT